MQSLVEDPSCRHFIEHPDNSRNVQDGIVALSQHYPRRCIEPYLPNEYYGFDYIVKFSLGLSPQKRLFFGLPHGIEFADFKGWNLFGTSERVSTLIYNNHLSKQNLIENNNRGFRFRAISPMLLLYKIMKECGLVPSTDLLSTALFFPVHGNPDWFLKNSNYDEGICRILRSLREKYQEIDISLTASDIRQGRHLIYESHGFRVITAGDIFDPFFSSRFINNVHRYGFILTSDLGSHIFYCAAFGLRVSFLQTDSLELQSYSNLKGDEMPAASIFPDVLQFTKLLNSPQAKKIALYLLGEGGIPRVHTYIFIHNFSRIMDFIGFIEPKGRKITFAIPRYWRRLALRVLHLLKMK